MNSASHRPSEKNLPEGELRQLAQVVVDDFHSNIGKARSVRRETEVQAPRSTNTSNNYLGLPAYAMLGDGEVFNHLPSRSKAFSMQMNQPACLSEEKKTLQ